MIGIVVVSHSRALADAAVGLAEEMVPAEARPAIRVAAGLDETTFGTDAAAIADALTAVDSPDGVLVLLDLGSAILSAEMALEFVDPETAERVRISPAPLVEGLVAAIVTASTGATLAEVAAEAEGGLAAKVEHSGRFVRDRGRRVRTRCHQPPTASGPVTEVRRTEPARSPRASCGRPRLRPSRAGRDRPAAQRHARQRPGRRPQRRQGRHARALKGHTLAATFSGPDAEAARERFLALAATDFGESSRACVGRIGTAPVAAETVADPSRTGRQVVLAPALVLGGEVDTAATPPATPAEESSRWSPPWPP
jgi:dihydroxyacetone kinase phosphotransfer subunit